MAAVSTPWFVVRNAYLVLIGFFLLGILAQAYFAGRFLFGADATSTVHVEFGWWMTHLIAFVVFLVSLFTRGGKPVWITSIVWVVVAAVLPVLPSMSGGLAALHPLLAMLLLGLTLFLTYRATQMVLEGRVQPAARAAPPAAPRAPVH